MNIWNLEPTDRYLRQYKKYDKKQKNELAAVLANLNDYHQALNELGSPQHITGKYVHRETSGVKALDESGERKTKNLKVTRLYVYPDIESKTLYLLTIGDKKSQRKDNKYCSDFVKELRRK